MASGTLSFSPRCLRSLATWAATKISSLSRSCGDRFMGKTPRVGSSGRQRDEVSPGRDGFVKATDRLPADRKNLASSQPSARTSQVASTNGAVRAGSPSMRDELGERDREQDAQQRRDQRPPPQEQGDRRQRRVVAVEPQATFSSRARSTRLSGSRTLAAAVAW